MKIEEIKEIRLEDYLHSMGLDPVKQQGRNLWYKSPFQEKEIPSFKVDTDRNRWCDFGTCKEGKIISLAGELCHTNDVSYIIQHIEEKILSIYPDILSFERQDKEINTFQYVQQNPQLNVEHLETFPLMHSALLTYLQKRGINTEVAKKECKELHFFISQNFHIAVGFPNVSGGYVMYNSILEGCTTKDISYIQQNDNRDTCFLFEEPMDYLSFLTIRKENSPQYPDLDRQDYIILNSLGNLSEAKYHLAKYEHIHCFFNNDYAGYEALHELIGEFSYHVRDFPNNYYGHNNLNDYLCSRLAEQHNCTTKR